MYARASTCFAEMRGAAGQYKMWKGPQPPRQPDATKLATLTASRRPIEITVIGYGGLVLILWLMW